MKKQAVRLKRGDIVVLGDGIARAVKSVEWMNNPLTFISGPLGTKLALQVELDGLAPQAIYPAAMFKLEHPLRRLFRRIMRLHLLAP